MLLLRVGAHFAWLVSCLLGMSDPSSCSRVLEYITVLRKHGIEWKLISPMLHKSGLSERYLRWGFPRTYKRLSQILVYFLSRIAQLLWVNLSKYDVILIQKTMMEWPSSDIFEGLITRRNSRIIFDIDDADLRRTIGREAHAHFLERFSLSKNVTAFANLIWIVSREQR